MQESPGAEAGAAGGTCRLEQPYGSDPVGLPRSEGGSLGLPLPATPGNPELCPVTHAPAQIFRIWISKGREVRFISAPVGFNLTGGWQLGGLRVSYHSFK